jgi:hypothetical protein
LHLLLRQPSQRVLLVCVWPVVQGRNCGRHSGDELVEAGRVRKRVVKNCDGFDAAVAEGPPALIVVQLVDGTYNI